MAISAYATRGSFTLIVTLRQRSFGFLFSLFWFLCLELRSTVLFSSESFELIPKQILMLYIAVNQTGHSLTKIEVFWVFWRYFWIRFRSIFFLDFWSLKPGNPDVFLFNKSAMIYLLTTPHVSKSKKHTNHAL